MAKKLAGGQSNYIPWKGYFDVINSVDAFVFDDDLQYTKLDWRNRNKIKTPNGLKWLTVPCGDDENRLISEVILNDCKWQRDHWNSIQLNYRNARYFGKYADFFEDIYLKKSWTTLSELNQYLIKHIAREFLDIKTVFEDSRRYNLKQKKAARVVEVCVKAEASAYLSGPTAKDYLSEQDFADTGIKLEWMDYSHYPEYRQLYPPFEHQVSVVDLIFNEGPDAGSYMKSFL